ncbi:helix-turn-helix transcriptional regulator, partial [Salmonella enterica subsp. arizonae]|nr:helix-turn-helix transcriptional regulator [Salmonella enterica subsp. arizonae]
SKQNEHFVKQVSTGIFDNKMTNLEISLPFCFFLYTKDRPFYMSFSGDILKINKGQAIFIKKSVPFSVLLNWGKMENGLVRNDIVSLKIPQQAIIEYNRHYIYKDQNEPRAWASNDYIIINFSHEQTKDYTLINALIESFPVTATGEILYDHVDEAKYMLILSLIKQKNAALEDMILSYSSLTTSEKVASLIMSDYSKNWQSKDLAMQMNMSVSTFKKKMYKDTGSVSSYITKIKMIEALRQLRRTNRPINSIAISLGYTSSSYFTSVFKKHFKIFPSEVRKNDGNPTEGSTENYP